MEVNSGKIFTEPRKRRGKYSQSHYSPRLRIGYGIQEIPGLENVTLEKFPQELRSWTCHACEIFKLEIRLLHHLANP